MPSVRADVVADGEVMLRSALAYLQLRLAVIPLEPNGKRPLTRHGVKDASADPDEVRAWWQRWPSANIGVAVPAGVIVVDVDVRNGGLETAAEWEAKALDVPMATPRQVTATGGSHTLLQRPPGQLRGKAGPGVDILGTGRYIVAAPSRIDGVKYRWTSPLYEPTARPLRLAPIAPCPAWLAALIRLPDAPSLPPPVQAPTNSYERAVAYLAKAEPAISGQGGSGVTFRIASYLVRGFALPLEQAYQAMTVWNATCDPPWTERELRRVLTRAQERGTTPMGSLLNKR